MINNPRIISETNPNGSITITLSDFCTNEAFNFDPETFVFYKIFRKLPLRLLKQIKIKLDEEIEERKGTPICEVFNV